MKKNVLLLSCLVATGSVAFAQGKKQPPPPPPILEVVNFKPPDFVQSDLEEFYRRNGDVLEISWKSKHQLTLNFKDKDRKPETYSLNNNAELETFKDKYGDMPRLVPPPPPPPKKNQQ